MMQLRVFALVLVALVCVARADEECQEEKVILKKEVNAILDGGELECATKHDLARFKCTAGEDPKEDEKKLEELKEYMGGLDDETKKEVEVCMEQIFGAATKEKSEDIGEECMNIIMAEMKAKQISQYP